MVAGFMPIYWASRAVIHLLVLTVETTAFTTRKAVYYTVGTRVSQGTHATPVIRAQSCSRPRAAAVTMY